MLWYPKALGERRSEKALRRSKSFSGRPRVLFLKINF
jgi:hypothetical protein